MVDIEGTRANPVEAGPKTFTSYSVYLLVVIFDLVFVIFSVKQIPPSSSLEASRLNLSGLLFSNFIYDGITNTEFIVISTIFFIAASFYYPRALRTFLLVLQPFVSLAAAGLSEAISIMSPFSRPPWCVENCPFYGMSGVASASVGYAFGSLFVALAVMFAIKAGLVRSRNKAPLERGRFRNQVALSGLFLAYLTLFLFYFLGAFTRQTPAVIIVHYASFAIGLLALPIIWILINHRYSLFFSPITRSSANQVVSKTADQGR